ncbi:MAG: UDP-N-acetylmuramoyl-L-alanyl-D-glutamate--2,6-diaminopimelate ligase [Clostridia bacterium]|nr:UDP-N-acetylmuramoyl-L-alanyl-D-glutamate--2,6-diaminopimelate ligase [Clostridia bacterium]
MDLKCLLKEATYNLPATVMNCEVTGVTADSREVRAGAVFVAIAGLHHNGADYINEALERGAVAVVCECETCDVPCVRVQNAREALARLTDAWYGHPARGMKLIGITGTNGKTSTATMLAWILRQAGYSCGLIGTVECTLNGAPVETGVTKDPLANMTTPDPAQLYAMLAAMRDGGADYVVMEVTSHALTFSKVAPLTFERALFTNLTPEHLDLHGDMESYFSAKRSLFAGAKGAVISCLTPFGDRLADCLEIPLWCLDRQNFRLTCSKGVEGSEFTINCEKGQNIVFSLPVAGDFFAENGAMAALTALSLGIAPPIVQRALSCFGGVRGRMERVAVGRDDVAVFLDYAHTPDALERLLYAVRGFRREKQRIVLLFGCGGDRDRSKRSEMGRIASRLADFVILTSDNCRFEDPDRILRDILKGVDKERPYKLIPDRRAAIAYAARTVRRGDILILAGKGHEEYEIRGNERLRFSERELLLSCFAQREGCDHAD